MNLQWIGIKQGDETGHDFTVDKGVKQGMKRGMLLQWIGIKQGVKTGHDFPDSFIVR
jgi:hypothetical protein